MQHTSVALGNSTEFAANPSDWGRVERFALQSVCRRLLPEERVRWCLRATMLKGVGPAVVRRPEGRRASYQRLCTCGLLWLCPVCASKITEERRKQLAEAIQAGRAAGYRVVLGSFTFSHGPRDRLADSVGLMLEAWRRMTADGGFKAFRRQVAWDMSVRALEVTWGQENGWHPHMHQLMFVGPDQPIDSLEQGCYAWWSRSAGVSGLSMTCERGVKVVAAGDDVDAYVAKFGRRPGRDPWGASHEMTKWHSKRGGDRADGLGIRLTPFDLLRSVADTGDAHRSGLFREYAAAMRGRHQLQYTKGMRRDLGLSYMGTDAEIAAKVDPEAVLLASLDLEDWRLVLRRDRRAELLDAAERGGGQAIVEFLEELAEPSSVKSGERSGV